MREFVYDIVCVSYALVSGMLRYALVSGMRYSMALVMRESAACFISLHKECCRSMLYLSQEPERGASHPNGVSIARYTSTLLVSEALRY